MGQLILQALAPKMSAPGGWGFSFSFMTGGGKRCEVERKNPLSFLDVS
jgi:hypothetical protein